MPDRLRLAYLSPLPPSPSGVADYSVELLPHLARRADVTLVVEPAWPGHAAVAALGLPTVSFTSWDRVGGDFDARLFHLGNHRSHAFITRALRERPGVLLVHDTTLFHLVEQSTLGDGDVAQFVREVAYCEGPDAAVAALAHARGERAMRWEEHPLIDRALHLAEGAIVHGPTAREALRARWPDRPVAAIPHHASTPRSIDPRDARRELGLPAEAPIVASFGLVTPSKRPESIVRAVASLRREPRPVLAFVGAAEPGVDLAALAGRHGVGDRLIATGRVPMERLEAWIAAADVVVSLRHPTAGETSGSLMRLFAAGKPGVVSDAGAFAELPRDACIRIPTGDAELSMLTAALDRLLSDQAYRESIGVAARALVADRDPESIAAAQLAFIAGLVSRRVVQ